MPYCLNHPDRIVFINSTRFQFCEQCLVESLGPRHPQRLMYQAFRDRMAPAPPRDPAPAPASRTVVPVIGAMPKPEQLLPVDIIASIVGFFEPIEAWPLRLVKRSWRTAVDRAHWPVVPRKIDGIGYPSDQRAEELRICAALSAITHLKALLRTGGNAERFTGEARGVTKALTERYRQYSRGKQIAQNCVAVFRRGPTRHFALNFWHPSWDQSMLTHALWDGAPVHPDGALMDRISHMHAEVRVLHAGLSPSSVDKPMCMFCAMTFQLRGEVHPHHLRQLEWYTFSTHIFSTRHNVATYFGTEFADLWFRSTNDERTRMLGYCVKLTNASTWTAWRENIERYAAGTISWDAFDDKPSSEGPATIGPKCCVCGAPRKKRSRTESDDGHHKGWICATCEAAIRS